MITQGQNQLLPEKTKANRKPRTLRYEISSLDRNLRTETSHAFRWRFPNPIRDVFELSIVGGTIPRPAVNISGTSTARCRNGYNKFTFVLNDVAYTITLTPAYYTDKITLAAELKTQLDAIGGPTFTVDFVGEYMRISCLRKNSPTNEFKMLFGSGSFTDSIDPHTGALLQINTPAIMLGFKSCVDYVSATDGTNNFIIAPCVPDLFFLVNRIYCFLNYDTTQDLVAFDRGIGRRQPTAIIYMDELHNDTKFLNKETFIPLIVEKPAPLARMSTLDIRFEDFFGNPLDFGCREVSLSLELVSLEP